MSTASPQWVGSSQIGAAASITTVAPRPAAHTPREWQGRVQRDDPATGAGFLIRTLF
ncbi:MAG TPA: hypothetical protein VK032_00600 [Burkholderiaceae bacterium]|nr:hypothetical protein [Burkholderiaceae bacterium]